MNTKPTPEILKYYQRLARAPVSGMKPEAIYISGLDPNDPQQVGLAK